MAENLDTYLTLGFKKPVVVFNSRDLMKGIPYEAIVAIDKLKKIGKEGVIEDMMNKGIGKDQAEIYFEQVQNIKPDETINTIIAYLEKSGFGKEFYRFEPTLARSFSYSQGPIWEIVVEDYMAGSVGGGERYDGLMERLTGLKISATGIGIGFDRTVEAADMLGLIPTVQTKTVVLVASFSTDQRVIAMETAQLFRSAGINTELYPEDSKIDKQLKYGNKKGIPFVAIIGADEVQAKKVSVKNMKTGEQNTMFVEDAIKLIKQND
jgi:histidyl-tRNA synthetase